MTAGTQPGTVAAAPAPTPPARSGRPAVAVAVALVMVLAVGALASLAHESGPVHPEEWDPRVVDLVHYVEGARDLRYVHPVSVYFLDEKTYSRIARSELEKPTAEDRRLARRKQVGELRALGVVEGDPDLLADSETLADAGTLAFYDFRSKVVNVRGDEMTPGLRATLVHELTHVLQDQHFDVTTIVDGPDSEASSVARSVVEGDAVDIEEGYVEDEMSEEDRQTYESERDDTAQGVGADVEALPDFLTTSFAAPYAFGPPFVQFFGSDRDGVTDNAKVDDLLRDPPPAMSRLFDPTDQLRRKEVGEVAKPKADGDEFDAGTLGAVTVFAMLTDRGDAVAAMDATDAWAGDSYVAYERKRDDRVCVKARVRPQAGTGSTLRDAFDAWRAAMPKEADVQVGGEGGDVTIETCDPGPIDTGIGDRFSTGIAYPVVRLQFAQSVFGEDAGRGEAICIGDEAVRQFTPAELSSEELTPDLEQKVTQSITAAAIDC